MFSSPTGTLPLHHIPLWAASSAFPLLAQGETSGTWELRCEPTRAVYCRSLQPQLLALCFATVSGLSTHVAQEGPGLVFGGSGYSGIKDSLGV